MGVEKKFPRRLLGTILLLMMVLCLLIVATGYWSVSIISDKLMKLISLQPDPVDLKIFWNWFNGFKTQFVHLGVPLIAGFFILWGVIIWISVRRNHWQPEPSLIVRPDEFENRQVKEQQDHRLFVFLLAMFQKEGRLLDFLSEKLDDYEDAQIGAAVRSIHENCKKVTGKYLSLQPVLNQEEGESITLQTGFDTMSVKLVGNVTGNPPFTGVIRHRGWKAEKLEIPIFSAGQDALLIAPAEVEI